MAGQIARLQLNQTCLKLNAANYVGANFSREMNTLKTLYLPNSGDSGARYRLQVGDHLTNQTDQKDQRHLQVEVAA